MAPYNVASNIYQALPNLTGELSGEFAGEDGGGAS
jgi:hypothetical protein